MKTDEVKIQTWADLKEFLDKQPDGLLQRSIAIMIDDNDSARFIETMQVLCEDHINPSGDAWEAKSSYLPGGEAYEADSETMVDVDKETVVGLRGQFFFSIP